jgi:hypothetical protein
MARSAASTATKEATPPANASPVPLDDKNDFFWTYTEEPHRTRRLAIIKAHPEVRIITLSSSLVSTFMSHSNKLMDCCPGPQAMRSRTSD